MRYANICRMGICRAWSITRPMGQDAALSVPTPEHFLPLLYVLGAKTEEDKLEIAVDGIEMGAISMLSVVAS